MRPDDARLLDILLACRDAMEFVQGATRDAFLADKQMHSAVCMKLQTIGEAARAVSEPYKREHPEIPWAQLAGLRHRIVHEYFRLDLAIVWEIVQRELPQLTALVEPLVPPPG